MVHSVDRIADCKQFFLEGALLLQVASDGRGVFGEIVGCIVASLWENVSCGL
jgi:hypothetical protein